MQYKVELVDFVTCKETTRQQQSPKIRLGCTLYVVIHQPKHPDLDPNQTDQTLSQA